MYFCYLAYINIGGCFSSLDINLYLFAHLVRSNLSLIIGFDLAGSGKYYLIILIELDLQKTEKVACIFEGSILEI